MNKFWTVLFHTYITRLKSKSFILTTIITALLLFGLVNIQQIIGWFSDGGPHHVAVLDQTGELYEPLAAQVQKTSDNLKLTNYPYGEDRAIKAVENGDLDGCLLLAFNHDKMPEATYKASKIADEKIPNQLKLALQEVKTDIATKQLGLSAQDMAKIYEPVSFHKVALEKGAKSDKELSQARSLVYVLLFLIYFTVIFFGSMIATEIATEKSSRVMEILISSVSPVKQMFGKIFGVALLSLTQYAVLFAVGFGSLKPAAGVAVGTGDFFGAVSMDAVPAITLVYAVVFFILGYLLYATLFAMLGSLVSRTEDSQQLTMPVTLIVLAGFYIAMFGLGSPESTLITVTSFIPFFAPMIMFLRVGLLPVPLWQILLCAAILIATIVCFTIIGARVYRGGVLMYGKTSWKNIKQALALSKAEK
jgi:ABC-2 type transport system permease protein